MPALIRAVIVGGERFEWPPAPGLRARLKARMLRWTQRWIFGER